MRRELDWGGVIYFGRIWCWEVLIGFGMVFGDIYLGGFCIILFHYCIPVKGVYVYKIYIHAYPHCL